MILTQKPKVIDEYVTPNPPRVEEQQRFWDQWNSTNRFGGRPDEFMDRQREKALEIANRVGLKDARILDAGCGTGWLGYALRPFGNVCGTDLSPAAIAEGTRCHPGLELICGDFPRLTLSGQFDFIIMCDSLTNMPDQVSAVRRVAQLLREGGTFLLMTPNREVWRRRSSLKPKGEGQFMAWPSLAMYKDLLSNQFAIESVSSIVPGGDQGLLWWVENRWVWGAMRRLIGRERWRNLLESAGLGRELVIVARRTSAPA